MTKPGRTTCSSLASVALVLLAAVAFAAPVAQAAPPRLAQFCSTPGTLGGQCSVPAGIATDPTTGHLYVIDNRRVNEFTPWGQFVKAFGGGVLSNGAAGSGVLSPGSTTVDSVTVTEKEFLVGMEIEGVGIAPGTTVAGSGPASLTLSKPATAAATGTPTSLTSPEAPGNVPVDEIQSVTVEATEGVFNLIFEPPNSRPTLAETSPNLPYNASAAEVQSALESLPSIGAGDIAVTSTNPGGQAGVPGGPYLVEFKGSRYGDTDIRGLAVGPLTITLKNTSGGSFALGFGNPTTTDIPFNAAAAEVESALTALSSVGTGNVDVTGPAGGPWQITFTGALSGHLPNGISVNTAKLTGASPSATTKPPAVSVRPVRQGASAPEVCTGSDCRRGVDGAGAGQFTDLSGIAVDSSGDLYVYESIGCTGGEGCDERFHNNRVQKFDSESNFLWMIGAGVNQGGGTPSHPGNICTAEHIADGDVCGGGEKGGGDGEFGAGGGGAGLDPQGNFIATGPGDTLYVGGKERIQVFDAGGDYLRSIALPGETVSALAVDNAPSSPNYGDIYVSYYSPGLRGTKGGPRRLDPDTGAELGSLTVPYPTAIATDSHGNVYVFQREFTPNIQTEDEPKSAAEVIQFDAAGKQILSFGQNELQSSIGIATSSACGIKGADVFVANAVNANPFINLYGEQPEADLCPPPPAAPSIAAQFVTATDTAGATLKAQINPHFWDDTRYYVQYGTGKCSEGGCDKAQPAAPGSLLIKKVVDADLTTSEVFLGGLAPNTIYHYRFVAQSSGGGPVSGVGGTESEEGGEGSFRTLPLAAEGNSACPNQAFRGGPSAKLSDCRAYELVSPIDKNNGDVATGGGSFAKAAGDGQRMTFSSFRSFGDSQSAPLTSQYLAERNAGEGWSTEAISPPRSTVSLYAVGGNINGSQYRSFSESLCEGWVLQDTDLAYTPGAPANVPNLYRRENCNGGSYELLTPTPPPGFALDPFNGVYFPEFQGASADQAHSVFRANAALAVEEGPQPPLTCASKETVATISYQWFRSGAPIPGASGANYTPTPEDQGLGLQCRVKASSAAGASVASSAVSIIAPLPASPPPDPGTPPSFATPRLPGMPTISGNPAVGETLTCTPGTWSGDPTFSYQWLANGAPIATATASTYSPQPADKGKALQCELSATNAGGAAIADSALKVVQAAPPAPSAAPTISGTAAVGETLTCNPGTWSGAPTFAYQWLRSGANIVPAAATAATYTLVAADAGKAIQCRVAGANADATVLAATPATVVAPPPATAPPALSVPGTLSGTATPGATLTCNAGSWSGSPTFARKWQRNGVNILGQSGETYELLAADAGKAIQCQVTATNAGGATTTYNAARYVASDPPAVGVLAYSVFHLYETYGGGKLRLVSILPDGTPTSTNTAVGTVQGTSGLAEASVYQAVSADGSRVFWTAGASSEPPTGAVNEPGPLYLRLNAAEAQSAIAAGQCAEAAKACTIPVSAASDTRFISADPEATRVIYSAGGQIFEAEIGESGGQTVATSQPIAAGFKGAMGTSRDATRVYLVSTQVLSGPQQNSEGATAQAGKFNAYLYEQGAGFTFIATLNAAEADGGVTTGITVNSNLPALRSSRVTPDGRHLAFTSSESLTGYDNTDVLSGKADAEAFVYDAAANGGEGRLVCASCNPSGARPTGRNLRAGSFNPFWAAAQIPGWTSQFQPSRLLSEDGQRLFFNAFDSLVPGDTNGRMDVYQWEAPGSGDCTEQAAAYNEANGGCLALISSGQSGEDSEFFDASASGDDVFFATQSSLVSWDPGLVDVYDARVDGGLPGPAIPPAACEGEACQGIATAPNDPTPASSAFQGAGNVKEGTAKPRCAKGKVRKAGKSRCVKKKNKAKKHHKRANPNRRSGR